METIYKTAVLTTCECCNCGMLFAMPQEYHQKLRDHGDSFWCPAGHNQHYVENTVTKLRKEAERAKANETWWKEQAEAIKQQRDYARRSATALKGVVTKVKKRIGNGVCPCCTRTFANLARHMSCKHPEYSESASA